MRKKTLLTIILFLSFAVAGSINAEYQIKDDGVYYGSIDKIEEADIVSFNILDREYATDKNNVYFRGEIISGADSGTFTRIQLPYTKDKDNVYYYETTIPGADPSSFVKLDNTYAKDKNSVYYKTNIITEADTSSFVVLRGMQLEDKYAKDKKNYYSKGIKIINEDDLFYAKTLDSDLVDIEFVERLEGKILLQVEQSGEAWYVHPYQGVRYYLGTPQDAFDIMRKFGIGMSNRDFEKIPVADMNLSNGLDSDKDGLSDQVEDAFGTDKNNPDTDSDGYNDKDEILSGYDPTGNTELDIDPVFVEGRKGFIYLQVNQNGEAWYINPDDGKRYFLGRPQDAFNVMRSLGLGITDEDLNKILEGK